MPKLVVLGATGTGKSSIVHQFLESTFLDKKNPSKLNSRGNSYTFTVVMNGKVHEVKIVDMPMINYFPANSYYEWNDFCGCALRSAHGYLLVFDLTSPGTFRYVKVIRDQLYESRDMQNIPVYVVGNKADLCPSVLSTMRGGHHLIHHPRRYHYGQHKHGFSSSHHTEDLTPAFKDLANLVKKQWKCSYIECSAKYNWRIVPIFRDILRMIELHQLKSLPESPSIQSLSQDHHLESLDPPSTSHHHHHHHHPLNATSLDTSGAQSNRSNIPTTTTKSVRTSNESASSLCAII